MVIEGNIQNVHVVSVVSQEFHAFGECKIRHAVILNCCALIKIKHAQRSAKIRKPNEKITKCTAQLVLYDSMGCLFKIENVSSEK
jgi:hypothetical protein